MNSPNFISSPIWSPRHRPRFTNFQNSRESNRGHSYNYGHNYYDCQGSPCNSRNSSYLTPQNRTYNSVHSNESFVSAREDSCWPMDSQANNSEFSFKSSEHSRSRSFFTKTDHIDSSLTDPWKGLTPKCTPESDCLVTKAPSHRHTVLFVSSDRKRNNIADSENVPNKKTPTS